jgi:hypothetical protein
LAFPLLYSKPSSKRQYPFSGDSRAAMITFDLRQTLIPLSLLQVANAFRWMKPGEEIEIFAGVTTIDAAILKDLLMILPRTDYDLISRENRVNGDPVTRLILRKKQSLKTHQQKGDSSCQLAI